MTDELQRFGELLSSRRTVNFFEPRPVDHQLIHEAVEVARWAPNHRLTQPWKFFHLGPETRSTVIDLAVELAVKAKGEAAGAARRERLEAVPEWLAVASRISEDTLLDMEDYAATCCAVQNLMLYLHTAGVGTKWTSGAVTREPATLHALGLKPDEYRVTGLIWIGYAKQRTESNRGPLSEVFSQLA